MLVRLFAFSVALLAFAACQKPADSQADLSAKAVEEIMAADRAFNDMAKEKGTGPAFAAFMDEKDGMLIQPGGDPIRGKEAIFNAQNDNVVPSPLVWGPEEGYAAKSGDFGVTWGRWKFEGAGPDGASAKATGKYTTVWRKNAEGKWKGLIDLGVRDPAPAPAAPATLAPPVPLGPDGQPIQLPPEIMEPPGPTNPGGDGNN